MENYLEWKMTENAKLLRIQNYPEFKMENDTECKMENYKEYKMTHNTK